MMASMHLSKRISVLLLVLLASCCSLVVSEAATQGETVLTRRLRPSKGSKSSSESTTGSLTASPTKSAKKSSKKSGTPCLSEGFCDVDGNGVFDVDDLNYVARAGSDRDPLGLIAPQEPAADVNEDGIVDLADYRLVLTALLDKLDVDNVEGVTLEDIDMFEESLAEFFGEIRRMTESAEGGEESDVMFDTQEAAVAMSRELESETCDSVDEFLQYFKGDSDTARPIIPWDNGHPYDPSATPTADDFKKWKFFGIGANVFRMNENFTDMVAAYDFYRDNSTARGDTMTFDLEKALQSEEFINDMVLAELEKLKGAIAAFHDGKTHSFEFYTTSSNLTYVPMTPNWKFATGAFHFWFTGKVVFHNETCELVADVTVHGEDKYNFNPGQVETVFNIFEDSDNGRFQTLGWAKQFYSRAEIHRELRVPVEGMCCQVHCPVTQLSGRKGTYKFAIDVGATQGVFDMWYDMYNIKDMLIMKHEGDEIFSTIVWVSGYSKQEVTFGSDDSTSSFVMTTVDAPTTGTYWELYVGCAAASP